MSNKQAQPSKKLHITNLLAVTNSGEIITFDISKVSLIDAATGKTILAPKVSK